MEGKRSSAGQLQVQKKRKKDKKKKRKKKRDGNIVHSCDVETSPGTKTIHPTGWVGVQQDRGSTLRN